MPERDEYELKILEADENGGLRSIATRAEIAKFEASARATAIKRVNIRLSSRRITSAR